MLNLLEEIKRCRKEISAPIKSRISKLKYAEAVQTLKILKENNILITHRNGNLFSAIESASGKEVLISAVTRKYRIKGAVNWIDTDNKSFNNFIKTLEVVNENNIIENPKENLKEIIGEAVLAIRKNIEDYKVEQELKIKSLQELDIEKCKIQYEANYKMQQGPQGTDDVFDTFEEAANDLIGKNFGVVFAFVQVGEMRVYSAGADVTEYNKGKKKKVKMIHVNLWNDYWEDEDDIPEGEVQETYMYVEDSEINIEDTKIYLEYLFRHIDKNIDLDGAAIAMRYYDSKKVYPSFIGTENEGVLFERWEIFFTKLTHKTRERIIKELQDSKLEFEGIPFKIYSES